MVGSRNIIGGDGKIGRVAAAILCVQAPDKGYQQILTGLQRTIIVYLTFLNAYYLYCNFYSELYLLKL